MSFTVPADAYQRFMGRFADPLATRFADATGVAPGLTALDVGCGPGALTAVLVERLGPAAVAAADPSEPFVAAAQARFPDVDVRQARAEDLPFDSAGFDVVLAQLVVHFMAVPVVGLREMARVARPGGVVAACVWDFGGDRSPLTTFWRAARELDVGAPGEAHLAGAREGQLQALFAEAGLPDADGTALAVEVAHPSFEDWWEPFTLGVGPAGAYLAALDGAARQALERRCRQLLPRGAFATRAWAWSVQARTPG